MKIKGDFITNSSSTAYVMCIPKNPDFINNTLELIKIGVKSKNEVNLLNEYFEELKELLKVLSDESVFEYLKRQLVDLQRGGINSFDNNDDAWSIYILSMVLSDYIVYKYDTGSSDGTHIDTINIENLKEVINKVEGL